jgi:hypothetical protein
MMGTPGNDRNGSVVREIVFGGEDSRCVPNERERERERGEADLAHGQSRRLQGGFGGSPPDNLLACPFRRRREPRT